MPLKDWPYGEDALLRNLDPKLIESHASHQLSRALNIGRVIAVAGSGLSTAYGKPSWDQLLSDFITRINAMIAFFEQTVSKEEPSTAERSQSAKAAEVQRIDKTRRELGLGNPKLCYTGDKLIAFQVLGELEATLIRWFDHARQKQLLPDLSQETRTVALFKGGDFRSRFKQDFFDERGPLRVYLARLEADLGKHANLFGRTNPFHTTLSKVSENVQLDRISLEKKDVKPASIARDEGRLAALSLYSPASIRFLAKKAAEFPDGPDRERREFFKLLRKNSVPSCQPALRFLTEIACEYGLKRALIDGIDENADPEKDIFSRWMLAATERDKTWSHPAAAENLDEVDATDFRWESGRPLRFDLNPDHRDPYNVLFSQLGIERYLTTNYDNEIEIMLRDRGFSFDAPTPEEEQRNIDVVNILGTRGDDIAFDESRIGDLIDFAAHGVQGQKRIMHLHGRAVADEKMVITEMDYQDLYLKDDGDRNLIDDALSLTFGGSPLLFVGLGMEEPDILRPLRAFSSQRDRLSDRVGVALLPRLITEKPANSSHAQTHQSKSDQNASGKQVELLSRYGVYSIYYGSANYKMGNDIDYENAEDRLFLAKLINNISFLRDISAELCTQLEKIAEILFSGLELSDSDLKRLEDSIRVALDAAKGHQNPAEVYGRDLYKIPKEVKSIEGESAGRVPIQHELRLIHHATEWFFKICAEATDLLAFASLNGITRRISNRIAGYSPEVLDQHLLHVLICDLSVLQTVFQRLEAACITPFFIARLSRIQHDWAHWRDTWMKPPQLRWIKPRTLLDLTGYVRFNNVPEKTQAIEFRRHGQALRTLWSEADAVRTNPLLNIERVSELKGDSFARARVTDRFFEGAPPPAISKLLAALRGAKGHQGKRRVFVLLSRKGAGSGHLFQALSSPDRFFDLCVALGITTQPVDEHRYRLSGEKNATDTDFDLENTVENGLFATEIDYPERFKMAASQTNKVHRAFLNLSSSIEVMSVFDEIAHFLFDAYITILKDLKDRSIEVDATRKKWGRLTNDRVGRLRFILWSLSQQFVQETDHRIVILVNQAAVLFSPDGRPKNKQLFDLFEALIKVDYRSAPVDLFLWLTETQIPLHFRPQSDHRGTENANNLAIQSHKPKRTQLCFQNLSWIDEDTSNDIEFEPTASAKREMALLEESGLCFKSSGRLDKQDGDEDAAYVHVIDDVRPLILGARFFPVSTIAICWREVANILFPKGYDKTRPWMANSRFASKNTYEPNVSAPRLTAEFEFKPESIILYQHRMRSVFESLLISGQANYDAPELFDDLVADMLCFWAVQDCLSSLDATEEVCRNGEWDQVNKLAHAAAELRRDTRAVFLLRRLATYKTRPTDNKIEPNQDETAALSRHLAEGLNLDLPPEKMEDLVNAFRKSRKAVVDLFNSINRIAGNNRYGLTAALALYEDIFEVELRLADYNKSGQYAQNDGRRFQADRLRRLQESNEVGESSAFSSFFERFDSVYQDTKLATGSQNLDNREDKLVKQTLLAYEAQHQTYAIWPFLVTCRQPDLVRELGEDGCRLLADCLETASGALIHRIQDFILVDLSLIAQPVDRSALAACPRIARMLDEIFDSLFGNGKLEVLRAEILRMRSYVLHWILDRILDLLIHRCLVFRLLPRESKADKASKSTESYHRAFRYVVHKTTRRLVFRRFATPLVDASQIDQLTVSLYPTQPNEMPRPSASAHRQIRELIETLTDYEAQYGTSRERLDKALLPPSISGEPITDDKLSRIEKRDLRDRTERLRAAHGALRAAYSAGIVTGFNSFIDADGHDYPDIGFLENHRLILRWMLREAAKITIVARGQDIVPPFYPEEVAWLFNECGVLSLVQGRMMDAAALFGQARQVALKHIEPDQAALIARIGLNKAICDIERGRSSIAITHLQAVWHNTEEHEALRWICKGYLGLIDHLRGDLRTALSTYDEVCEHLTRLDRFRAASIFTRHAADLLRRRSIKDNPAEAIDRANLAIRLATNGNHEDIRQLAFLSRLKTDRLTKDIKSETVIDELAAIESYSRIVGAPRFRVETLNLRADVLLDQGDRQLAAEETIVGLRLSTRLDLQLRKVTGLMKLARIFDRQNRSEESERLLQTAATLATRAEFYSARDSVQRVLSPNT